MGSEKSLLKLRDSSCFLNLGIKTSGTQPSWGSSLPLSLNVNSLWRDIVYFWAWFKAEIQFWVLWGCMKQYSYNMVSRQGLFSQQGSHLTCTKQNLLQTAMQVFLQPARALEWDWESFNMAISLSPYWELRKTRVSECLKAGCGKALCRGHCWSKVFQNDRANICTVPVLLLSDTPCLPVWVLKGVMRPTEWNCSLL